MPKGGTPINRQWIVVLNDGRIVIDWGDDVFQDIREGDFISIREEDISHHITKDELDWLIKIGRVASYDAVNVHVHNLPERPQRTID
jgi:hypothetical protein